MTSGGGPGEGRPGAPGRAGRAGGGPEGRPGAGGPGFGTLAVHGGPRSEARERGSRPHAPPIHQTSAFSFPDVATALRAFEEGGDFIYSRLGNPTVRELERHVAALEAYRPEGASGRGPAGEVDARFFATGMAAISAVFLGVAAGRRAVCQDGIYGTTLTHARGLSRYGIRVDFAPAGDLEALRRAVEGGEPPALVYVETPANPLLQTTELGEASEIAHEAGALLAVDGTFATPALQRPLAWGTDLAVHSTTKFMAGHGVALGGVVSGGPGTLERHLDPVRKFFGGAPDPTAAWLTLLGLRTLAVRMERHAANALALADFLRGHEAVERVWHPDPARLPEGQLLAGGPMLSFGLAGGLEAAVRTIDRLRLASLTPSLGTVDTLVQHPYTMSHGLLPEERRLALGIGPGLVRVSVGLEDAADIVEDFRAALEA